MGSKSGGGDPSAYQRELRAEQDQAIQQLNALFGLATPTATVNRDDFYDQAKLAEYRRTASNPRFGGATMGADLLASFDDAGYQAALARSGAGQDAVRQQRDALYEQMGADVFNVQKSKLDDQQQKAARLLKFALARNGQTGGSLDIDQHGDMNKSYLEGMADIGNNRISTTNNVRAADEQTRIDLIGRIRSGMDQASALNSAASQLQSNIAQQRDSALASTMRDYFGGMGYLNQQAQFQKQYGNTYRTPSGFQASASNGTLGRY